VTLLLGVSGYTQNAESNSNTQNTKMTSALLQLKSAVVNNIAPAVKKNSTHNKPIKRDVNVVAVTSMLPPRSKSIKNVDVFIVEDSKMEIVKTKPIQRTGETPPEHLNAMKAALGIQN